LDKQEMNSFQIKEAKKVEPGQDLIQKNMKLISNVFNKEVLRKSFLKKWKNSIMKYIQSRMGKYFPPVWYRDE